MDSGTSSGWWPLIDYEKQKKSVKGEDFILCMPDVEWRDQKVAVFGVFDGHGGSSAGAECKRAFVEVLLESLNQIENAAEIVKREANAWVETILPTALSQTFQKLDERCNEKFNTSGTTATVAVVTFLREETRTSKWAHVTIANTGDSHVYAQTDDESYFRLNADHRLDNNKKEQERIIQSGGEVERCSGKNSKDKNDPLRLWPGGLMMSRTIGDPEAPLSLPIPSIRTLSVRLFDPDDLPLPCRLILASDGLWDPVPARKAFALVGRKNSNAAAPALVHLATKKAGNEKDDISVIVLDLAGSKDDFLADKRKRQLSSCSQTSIGSLSSFVNKHDSTNSDRRLHYLWANTIDGDDQADHGPIDGTPPFQSIEEFEVSLAALKLELEENKRLAEEERAQLEEALKQSMISSENVIDAESFDIGDFSEREQQEIDDARIAAELAADQEDNEPYATGLGGGDEWVTFNKKKTNKKKQQQEPQVEQPATKKKKKKTKNKNKNGGDDAKEQHEQETTMQEKQEMEVRPEEKQAEKNPCFDFFKKGLCKFGDSCRYSHDETVYNVDTIQELEKIIDEGGTKKKKKKTKKNNEIGEDEAAEEQEQNPIMMNGESDVRVEEPVAVGEDYATKTVHNNKKKKKPCFAFFESNSCPYGDTCKYSHDAVDNPIKHVVEQPKQPQKKKKTKKKNPCFEFFRDGTCGFGDECKFSHDENDRPVNMDEIPRNGQAPPVVLRVEPAATSLPQPSQHHQQDKKSSKKKKPCFEFFRDGKCSFGDECKYSHDEGSREAGLAIPPKPSISPSCDLMATRLPQDLTEEQLYSYLSKFGEFESFLFKHGDNKKNKPRVYFSFKDKTVNDHITRSPIHKIGTFDVEVKLRPNK